MSYDDEKINFFKALDKYHEVYEKLLNLGDTENSNSDSDLVSTKRCLLTGELFKDLYQTYFLKSEERKAADDGYIYIHDKNFRLSSMNCCLFDIGYVLKNGFELGNIWYNKPKTLKTAMAVISDVVLSCASQQYGGFTLPEIDTVLVPYCKETFKNQKRRYEQLGLSKNKAIKEAMKDVETDLRQGIQGWEYKFNTVASSRGDYPFITITFGLSTDKFGKLVSHYLLDVRKKGQGADGKRRPVLFPKLVFLYDKNLHKEGKELYNLFLEAIDCSSKCMYPDFLSLTGDSYVSDIYKKYKRVISPMGCRAYLSPWYERGGMNQEDENDKPVYIGRFNIGAITLNLPMILQKSRVENKNFYEVLDYYLEMIRDIHKRTLNYLGKLKANINPVAFCYGGFLGGHLSYNDEIAPVLKSTTASFGITALNELQRLFNGKSIKEDGDFAFEVMQYINKKISKFKKEDNYLYAIYGTPGESMIPLQVKKFREKYGVIKNVSDRDYFSNSFHCHVSERITPIEKQSYEKRFYDTMSGGQIQYCKYPINYNLKAIQALIERAMELGFYEGVNLDLSYCNSCGYEQLDMEVCPKCNSTDIIKVNRMNGYLSYSRVKGKSRLNEGKMLEIKDRISM